MGNQHKFILDESRLPKAWYNINADLPVPPQPVLHPGTMEPVTPDFLSVLFPMSIIMFARCASAATDRSPCMRGPFSVATVPAGTPKAA